MDHPYTAVAAASLPFDPADDYEYWLLYLPRETRRRLVRVMAARDHVFAIELLHAVYSEVVEDGLLKAATVEAKLRRSNSPEQSKLRA